MSCSNPRSRPVELIALAAVQTTGIRLPHRRRGLKQQLHTSSASGFRSSRTRAISKDHSSYVDPESLAKEQPRNLTDETPQGLPEILKVAIPKPFLRVNKKGRPSKGIASLRKAREEKTDESEGRGDEGKSAREIPKRWTKRNNEEEGGRKLKLVKSEPKRRTERGRERDACCVYLR